MAPVPRRLLLVVGRLPVRPYVTPEIEDLLRDPVAPGFLDHAAGRSPTGLRYGLAKFGLIRAAARASWRGARAADG